MRVWEWWLRWPCQCDSDMQRCCSGDHILTCGCWFMIFSYNWWIGVWLIGHVMLESGHQGVDSLVYSKIIWVSRSICHSNWISQVMLGSRHPLRSAGVMIFSPKLGLKVWLMLIFRSIFINNPIFLHLIGIFQLLPKSFLELKIGTLLFFLGESPILLKSDLFQ